MSSVELFGTDTLGEFIQRAVEKMADNDTNAVQFTAELDGKAIHFRLEVTNVTDTERP